jgi:hypothetical protein
MECHTSRFSIRSLKSSTVSIAKVSDHIQTFLKWSVMPIAALTAMVFISSARPASLANTAAVRRCAACASRETDGPSRSRPQLMWASNAEPDKLRLRFSHHSRGYFFRENGLPPI